MAEPTQALDNIEPHEFDPTCFDMRICRECGGQRNLTWHA